MNGQTARKALELVGTALLGAGCVLAYPLVRKWNARPVRVLITGAAGQIGYALAPLVAKGLMLGQYTPIILHLLDIPSAKQLLDGVKMELQDGILTSTDNAEAWKDVDVAILVAGFPRKQGMERKDVMAKNVSIYKEQARALVQHASRDVKIVVVANPANTNALVLKEHAIEIPPENITCLTRLDHNRALAQLAEHVECHVSDVKNVTIWGNHSSTQYPDINHASIVGLPSKEVIRLMEKDWNEEEFSSTVQQRGAAILAARNMSSALSAACAVCDHVRDWLHGTPRGEWVSMGVISDGSYGVPEGLMYSFPVTCRRGNWSIVPDLTIDEFAQQKLKETADELVSERAMAMQCLGSGS